MLPASWARRKGAAPHESRHLARSRPVTDRPLGRERWRPAVRPRRRPRRAGVCRRRRTRGGSRTRPPGGAERDAGAVRRGRLVVRGAGTDSPRRSRAPRARSGHPGRPVRAGGSRRARSPRSHPLEGRLVRARPFCRTSCARSSTQRSPSLPVQASWARRDVLGCCPRAGPPASPAASARARSARRPPVARGASVRARTVGVTVPRGRSWPLRRSRTGRPPWATGHRARRGRTTR